MELKEQHIANLRALRNGEPIRKSELPHPKYIALLSSRGLVNVIGDSFFAHVEITEEGKREYDENHNG